ncbi:hypothetical protein SK571_03675 [Lentzea sp. BCCO 10_0798]|uniref:Uncharacterized protein n=1 Tax=Lentzea kristufekii TaxID=3095430 RepID=A0ABU4TJN5_9PSEU|nr:hypothetical protein [Lentzea sp. BCCO 10_0798]MDX8048470.1 hypothetical protein [Lentzea sp. BCCO 10_0798]
MTTERRRRSWWLLLLVVFAYLAMHAEHVGLAGRTEASSVVTVAPGEPGYQCAGVHHPTENPRDLADDPWLRPAASSPGGIGIASNCATVVLACPATCLANAPPAGLSAERPAVSAGRDLLLRMCVSRT